MWGGELIFWGRTHVPPGRSLFTPFREDPDGASRRLPAIPLEPSEPRSGRASADDTHRSVEEAPRKADARLQEGAEEEAPADDAAAVRREAKMGRMLRAIRKG